MASKDKWLIAYNMSFDVFNSIPIQSRKFLLPIIWNTKMKIEDSYKQNVDIE